MESIPHKYLPVMRQHYPEIQASSIKVFDGGHDHYIFLLPNGVAFRFPRGEEYGKKDEVENSFLPKFAKISPSHVQVFQTYDDNKIGVYQTYKFIQGIQFLPELAKSFSKKDLMQIARDMGSFLKVLHSYPLDKAREVKMDELEPTDYYEYFEKIWTDDRKVVYPLLNAEEKTYLNTVFLDYIATKEASFIPHVTHNDAIPEHIIIDDKKHQLSGVIDFALRIADPARDFMFLHMYGDDFLKEALNAYGEVDNTFMKRRAFYGANFYVMYLYNAIIRGGDMEKVEKYRHALSSYIKGGYVPS